ncbi:hypothetical protein [Pseudoalteromonas phenolica]|uniref:hypothetical protein n=1 Tax=Pseudoalteromonas phenolica TaxID=161398 RepID=UPI00137644B2|nr:hypothetical protein [Pseudoalteromonas phenolica]
MLSQVIRIVTFGVLLTLFFFKSSSKFELENYKPNQGLGAPLGYVVWQTLNEKGWLSPFQYEPAQGLKMVAQGKLDGYVVERLIGLNLLFENHLQEEVTYSQNHLLDTTWYLPFNKNFYLNNQVLVENFWFELNNARAHLEKKHKTLSNRKSKTN